MKNAAKRVAVLLMSLLLAERISASPALTIPDAPQTPEGKMAESAGAYLGSLEWIRGFKSSDCRYALPKTFMSMDAALTSEVLPAFPPNARNEVVRAMRGLKPEMTKQAENYVGGLIAAAKKDFDKQTACGFVAGMLGGISFRTYEKWAADKQQYGWK